MFLCILSLYVLLWHCVTGTTKLFAGGSLKLDDLESDEKSCDSCSSDRTQHNGIPPAIQINLKQVQIAPVKTFSFLNKSVLMLQE